MTQRISFQLILVVLIVVISSGLLMGKKPPKPGSDVPCDATSITINNNSDCGKSMQIDVLNYDAVEDILCPPCTKKPAQNCESVFFSWIGGTVIADASKEHGFYFEPNGIIVCQSSAEGMQTSICQISDNPTMYDGGTWYIGHMPAEITEY